MFTLGTCSNRCFWLRSKAWAPISSICKHPGAQMRALTQRVVLDTAHAGHSSVAGRGQIRRAHQTRVLKGNAWTGWLPSRQLG